MSFENLPDMTTLLEWAQPFLVKLAIAALILVAGLWIARRVNGLIQRMILRTRKDQALASFIGKIAQAVVAVFAIIAALGHLGVDTTAAAAIVGGSALAIGLSLQKQLSSFAAGIMLVMFRPFRIGDFVDAGGISGTVVEIHMVKTVLRTGNNQIVHIPNASIWDGAIVNYSSEPTRRIDLKVGVSYDADLRKTRQILENVLAAEQRILPEPAPVIAVSELGDSAVVLLCRPWVNTSEYWPTLWSLTEAIKLALDDAGIGIPYPQMDVHLHQQQSSSRAA